ncbi:MAG: TIGR03790 family protein [Kiritimatiellae bacterium]|nr:TIGR03790 family protein [Kiritimatiellia bacterium]
MTRGGQLKLVTAVWLVGCAAGALGPHELLVVVNERSRDSWELAREYAVLRGVPPENLVGVEVPDSALRAEGDLSLEEFERHIRLPVFAAMRARGIEDRILAFVYSADLPVRVRGAPPVSLHGATLVGGQLPSGGLIATGLWISALFRGPPAPGGPALPTATLDQLKRHPAAAALMPAMSLTWSGARGLPRHVALALLRRSAAAGPAWASGTVYLVTGTDIRARCRQWQIEDAAREIRELGVRTVVTSNFPAGASDVAGLMMGAAAPEPSRIAAFLPGAVADHLTSFGAVFHGAAQTKLTAWLRAGASAAAGTVTEPYSIWMKFPAARLFAHLARGCTALEAYYQSVASPLQLFIVGDPLLAPRASPPKVRLSQKEENRPELLAFELEVEGGQAEDDVVMFLLDGRTVALQQSSLLRLEASSLAPGHHRLRAVLYRGGDVRVQAFAETGFEWGPPSRRVRILSPTEGAEVDERRGTTVLLEAGGAPSAVALFAGARKVAEGPGAARELKVRTWPGGPGPVELQAVAAYTDGTLARSAPVRVRIVARNRPPSVGRAMLAGGEGERRWVLPAEDPDGDPLVWSWWVPIALNPPDAMRPRANDAVPKPLHRIALADAPMCRAAAALWRPTAAPPGPGVSAAVLGDGGTGVVWCFGWSEEKCAWVLGTLTESNLTVRVSRGRPALAGGEVRMMLRVAEDGALEGWTDDTLQCRWPAASARPFCRVGFAAGDAAVTISDCLAELPAERLREGGRSVAAGDAHELVARISDGWTSVWRRVSR